MRFRFSATVVAATLLLATPALAQTQFEWRAGQDRGVSRDDHLSRRIDRMADRMARQMSRAADRAARRLEQAVRRAQDRTERALRRADAHSHAAYRARDRAAHLAHRIRDRMADRIWWFEHRYHRHWW
jgi:hypothetical protein